METLLLFFLCILIVQYHELNRVQSTKANNIYCTLHCAVQLYNVVRTKTTLSVLYTHFFYYFWTLSTDTGSLVLKKKIYVGYVFSVHSFRKKFQFFSTLSFLHLFKFQLAFSPSYYRCENKNEVQNITCRLQITYYMQIAAKLQNITCRLQIADKLQNIHADYILLISMSKHVLKKILSQLC